MYIPSPSLPILNEILGLFNIFYVICIFSFAGAVKQGRE